MDTDRNQMLQQFEELPPQAQQEVVDFIAFLRQRRSAATAKKLRPVREEPFVGMWKDRDEMADSTRWGRSVREREWR